MGLLHFSLHRNQVGWALTVLNPWQPFENLMLQTCKNHPTNKRVSEKRLRTLPFFWSSTTKATRTAQMRLSFLHVPRRRWVKGSHSLPMSMDQNITRTGCARPHGAPRRASICRDGRPRAMCTRREGRGRPEDS